jgi:hypothetical protein
LGRPIAAPLDQCAKLLGVDLAAIRKLAVNVEPLPLRRRHEDPDLVNSVEDASTPTRYNGERTSHA